VNVFVSPLTISIGLVTIALIAAFIAARSRRDRGVDLGEVSNQWVMEHRMGPGHDSSRWNQR
jgi:hypothetical protein